MARSDGDWVRNILSAIGDIRTDTAGIDFARFANNPTVMRSVLYSIAVIGEAAKKVSPGFKAACPGIPWRAIAGIRDRIVHEYFRTNHRQIWEVVEDDIDDMERQILDGIQKLRP
jgi:uncharacterized protein with HEPN domain